MFGRLVTEHNWPVLATNLLQSNNAAANSSAKSGEKGGEKSGIKRFRCKGNHHVKDCPQKAKNKGWDVDKDADKDLDETATKKSKASLPAWRYVEPKDLTTGLVDNNDKTWKFCTKCVCQQFSKKGLNLLSRFQHEHRMTTLLQLLPTRAILPQLTSPLVFPRPLLMSLPLFPSRSTIPLSFKALGAQPSPLPTLPLHSVLSLMMMTLSYLARTPVPLRLMMSLLSPTSRPASRTVSTLTSVLLLILCLWLIRLPLKWRCFSRLNTIYSLDLLQCKTNKDHLCLRFFDYRLVESDSGRALQLEI